MTETTSAVTEGRSLTAAHKYLSEQFASTKTFPTAKDASTATGISIQTMQHALRHQRAMRNISGGKGVPSEPRPRDNSRTMKIARFIFQTQKDTGKTPSIEEIVAQFSTPEAPCNAQVVRNAIAYLQKRGTITRSEIRWTFKKDFEAKVESETKTDAKSADGND